MKTEIQSRETVPVQKSREVCKFILVMPIATPKIVAYS